MSGVERQAEMVGVNIIQHAVDVPNCGTNSVRPGVMLVEAGDADVPVDRREFLRLAAKIRELRLDRCSRHVGEAAMAVISNPEFSRSAEGCFKMRFIRPD